MTIRKEDLLFNDYNWETEPDNAIFQGEPDRNMFHRNEGNDVLYMINYFCSVMNYDSKIHAGKMEILIHEKMPFDIKSQNSVFNWLKKEYAV